MTGTEGGNQQRWSVGALAKATGVTVRTLHHYDELGLLRPGARTASGHRRYTEADLHRLYQIRLLRQLGMSLGEIGEVLADSCPDALHEVLDRRLEEIDDQLWRLNLLRRQIRNMQEQLRGSFLPDSGQLLVLLGRTSEFHENLTKEQRIFLDERVESLGEDGRKRLDAEWVLVFTKLVEYCRAGVPVDDPEVQEITRRLFWVIETFTGGDREIIESVAGFFREQGAGVLLAVTGGQQNFDLGDELWDYVSRATATMSAE